MIKKKIVKLILLGSFFVVSLASQAYDAVITVNVTIKPGGEPNFINLNSKGLIPVAILGSPSFDVTWIKAASLTFSARFLPSTASPVHQGGHFEDVNGDGFIDLLLHFRTKKTEDRNTLWCYRSLRNGRDIQNYFDYGMRRHSNGSRV